LRGTLKDGLENLFPDSVVGDAPVTSASFDVARGGTAAVHILLNGLREGDAVRLKARGKSGAPPVEWFRLIDVPVERNTGPVGRTEREGERNESVVRRAPFRTYDAMEPVSPTAQATAPTLALRLHIPVPADARPGVREYDVTVKGGGETAEFHLAVRVHKPVIPPIGPESWPYSNWFRTDLMASRHSLTPWSEPHWRMIRKYADLMARARQNVFTLSAWNCFERTPNGPTLNVPRMGRLVRTFTAAGLYYIECSHVAYRTGNKWTAPTFDCAFSGPLATSSEGRAWLASMCGQLMREIRRHCWQDRWLQHVADEPITENAADFRLLCGIVRRHMPGIPLVDATMHLDLHGALDIWCPQPQEYQANREWFERQRAAGDKVWFYTCLSPGGAWLNRCLDFELLRPALFGWAAARFQLDGFLHWAFNDYFRDQDPFQQSVVRQPEGAAPPGVDEHLPAGDTHVCYPGTDGPWSSLRLEAQREGIEDYELLTKLRERNPEKANAVIQPVLQGFDSYTRSIAEFRAGQKRLLESF